MPSVFFFFNDTATTEIYTLSLHDALPISENYDTGGSGVGYHVNSVNGTGNRIDRKSTRLNSSHQIISYAVFCLKKKKTRTVQPLRGLGVPIQLQRGHLSLRQTQSDMRGAL